MNDRLEVRQSNFYYLFAAIFGTGTLIWSLIIKYDENIEALKENLVAAYIFGGIIIIVLGLTIYKSFDKRIKLIIDKNGIWNKKIGQISWDDIYRINHSTNKRDELYMSYLIVYVKNRVKPYKINYSELKIGEKQLFDAITKHRDFNIYEIDYDF